MTPAPGSGTQGEERGRADIGFIGLGNMGGPMAAGFHGEFASAGHGGAGFLGYYSDDPWGTSENWQDKPLIFGGFSGD